MKKTLWGQIDTNDIYLFELSAGDYKANICSYGALLTHLYMPDSQGGEVDIVLGFDDLQSYLKPHPFFGATVGRFGNRIKNGQFELGGKTYQLSLNEGKNQLHGGIKGFDKQIWHVEELSTNEGEAIKLTYISPDGEEGFPGELKAEVTYHLFDDGRLLYDVKAISDADTICSIINHSYFNLKGDGDILDHKLWLKASSYTKVDDELIPTGEVASVKDTGLDFTQAQLLSQVTPLMDNHSYDHNFILDDYDNKLRPVAVLSHEDTGRILEVSSTLPCLQLYNSAVMAKAKLKGKKGTDYPDFGGICLETQFAPNSMNEPQFTSPILRAGDIWHHQTVFHMKQT